MIIGEEKKLVHSLLFNIQDSEEGSARSVLNERDMNFQLHVATLFVELAF